MLIPAPKYRPCHARPGSPRVFVPVNVAPGGGALLKADPPPPPWVCRDNCMFESLPGLRNTDCGSKDVPSKRGLKRSSFPAPTPRGRNKPKTEAETCSAGEAAATGSWSPSVQLLTPVLQAAVASPSVNYCLVTVTERCLGYEVETCREKPKTKGSPEANSEHTAGFQSVLWGRSCEAVCCPTTSSDVT